MDQVVSAIQTGNTRLLLWIALLVILASLLQVVLNYHVGERLKAKILSNSDARLESLRSDLRVAGRAREKKQDVLIEMIDAVGEAQVATSQLVRVHQDPARSTWQSWEVWQQRAEALVDFITKYRSPYMHKYNSEIDSLLKAFNDIPEALRAATAAGSQTYAVSFDDLLATCNSLKDQLYADSVQIADRGTPT
jgi:hypothetical protein